MIKLRYLLLQEEKGDYIAPPEGESSDVFGQYLFAPLRTDVPLPKEQNTPLENRFQKDISQWLDNPKQISYIDELFALKNSGKYSFFLQPPSSPVYRGITINIEECFRLLGITEKEIAQSKGMPKLYKKKIILNPTSRNSLQSWTYSPRVALDFTNLEFLSPSVSLPSQVSIVFIASSDRSNFIFNFQNVKPFIQNAEYETVSYGPVKCDGFILRTREINPEKQEEFLELHKDKIKYFLDTIKTLKNTLKEVIEFDKHCREIQKNWYDEILELREKEPNLSVTQVDRLLPRPMVKLPKIYFETIIYSFQNSGSTSVLDLDYPDKKYLCSNLSYINQGIKDYIIGRINTLLRLNKDIRKLERKHVGQLMGDIIKKDKNET